MSLKQKLEHRQKAVFSQSLQQNVKFLELPLLELKSVVESEIAENPAIEEIASSANISSNTPADKPKIPTDESDHDTEDETTGVGFDGYEKPIFNWKESLSDFLLKQLRINADDDLQIRIGAYIIQNIDENGYLRQDLNALSKEIQIDINEISKVLQLIQTFDPPGVAARDLKECLLIQLKKKSSKDPLAEKLIETCLNELADKNTAKLLKKLKCSEEELKNSLAKIHALEPKPGRSFSREEIAYCIPDIFIEEKNDELQVIVKDDVIPLIRINPVYKKMLKNNTIDEKTKDFIKERLLRANNLIRAIQSRKDTLLKVVSFITETQKEAVLEGKEKLKPLSLKEVAQKTGLHESTISRVVANKYIQAPAGILALRDLFSVSLKTAEGENIAAERIKEKIAELIEGENKTKPLKDHEIAQLINESEKTLLARRTIAKYRESLKIPPVSKRRSASN